MIVLDTNVVSELANVRPNETVLHFFADLGLRNTYIPSVVLAEIRHGIELLTPSHRRRGMEAMVDEIEHRTHTARILVFDALAAKYYASIRASRKLTGRPIAPLDAQIAAIARANTMRLATRNVRDFADTGVDLVAPFAP